MLVSIAIVVTLIAVFIPGFDNYKKRQGGTEVAQQIIQQVQLARSYALAPNVANFPTSDATKNIIEFTMVNNSDDKIQYIIGRTDNLTNNLTLNPDDYIKSQTVIEGDWHIVYETADGEYFNPRLTIGFNYHSGDLSIFNSELATQGTGYTEAIYRRAGISSLPFYIVPTGQDIEYCADLSKGCVKIDLNLITGAMTYVPYKN